VAALTGITPPGAGGDHVVLAPLARLVLDVRLVILFVGTLGLSIADQAGVAIVLLALMAVTSAGPVLAWRLVGGWILRHPVAASLDLAVALAVLLAGAGTVLGIGYVVSTTVLLGVLYGRRGGLVLAVPLVLACGSLLGDGDVTVAVAAGVLVLVGARVGAELRRLVLALDDAREQARVRAREAAVAAERERLARELHDSVAKTLVGIGMSATALRQRVGDDDPAAMLVDQIEDASRQAVSETRALLHGLRIDDLSLPLDDSLRHIADTFARVNGLDLEVDVDLDGAEVDPAVRYEVVQIVREALRNVAQHADAQRVRLHLAAAAEGDLRLEVVDDGRGMPGDPVGPGHYGVQGMRERAGVIGGELEVGAGPDGGTRLVLRVPGRVRA
jgi:signal transduction histidine kinase